MHTDVINDFIDREVEVSTTSSKTFTGTLKHYDSTRGTVVIAPVDIYSARRYGPVTIKQNDIVTICELLPQIDEDGDEDCDVPKAKYKASQPAAQNQGGALSGHDMGVATPKSV